MPTIERLRAEVMAALVSRATDDEQLNVEQITLPESGRAGYRLTIEASIVIDRQHLEAL